MRFKTVCAVLVGSVLFGAVSCDNSTNGPGYPTEGLISYFPFNGNLADVEGNTPGGISNGGDATYGDGKFGKALTLNGIDQYISFNREQFSEDNKVSVAFWMKTSIANSLATAIVCNDFSVVTNGGTAHFSVATPDVATAFGNFADEEWTHLAGTYDGTEIKIYLNSILIRTTDHPGTLQDFDLKLTVGFKAPHFWQGAIDDLYIYNRVLEQRDVSELYVQI